MSPTCSITFRNFSLRANFLVDKPIPAEKTKYVSRHFPTHVQKTYTILFWKPWHFKSFQSFLLYKWVKLNLLLLLKKRFTKTEVMNKCKCRLTQRHHISLKVDITDHVPGPTQAGRHFVSWLIRITEGETERETNPVSMRNTEGSQAIKRELQRAGGATCASRCWDIPLFNTHTSRCLIWKTEHTLKHTSDFGLQELCNLITVCLNHKYTTQIWNMCHKICYINWAVN